jgi:hypothetical protein
MKDSVRSYCEIGPDAPAACLLIFFTFFENHKKGKKNRAPQIQQPIT